MAIQTNADVTFNLGSFSDTTVTVTPTTPKGLDWVRGKMGDSVVSFVVSKSMSVMVWDAAVADGMAVAA